MESLFDTTVYAEVIKRIGSLTAKNTAKWGKMDVAQMLAHCTEAFKVPLSEKPTPRMFMGYIFGGLLKRKLYDDSPMAKNLPTAPSFKIVDERSFEKERAALLALINEFHVRGPQNIGKFSHPFFGTLTGDEWGKGMYKHLNHHLEQFGV